jgi:hypothetical protein
VIDLTLGRNIKPNDENCAVQPASHSYTEVLDVQTVPEASIPAMLPRGTLLKGRPLLLINLSGRQRQGSSNLCVGVLLSVSALLCDFRHNRPPGISGRLKIFPECLPTKRG